MLYVQHPRQPYPYTPIHAREYRSYTAGFSRPSHGRAPDPPRGENPSSVPLLGMSRQMPCEMVTPSAPLYSAVLFEAPSHPAAPFPRARRLLRAHSTVNDDEFISAVARTENLITFPSAGSVPRWHAHSHPRLMSVTVVVIAEVITSKISNDNGLCSAKHCLTIFSESFVRRYRFASPVSGSLSDFSVSSTASSSSFLQRSLARSKGLRR